MGKFGKMNVRGLKEFQKELNRLQEPDKFVESCARELAARLLAKVIKRTPVGDYSKEVEVIAKRNSKHHKKGDKYTKRINPSGKQGGTLRRGWTSETEEEAENGKGSPTHEEILEYVNGVQVSHSGDIYKIEIINPVSYASYVESGHRQKVGRYVPALGKRLKQGWVPGQRMMKMSEQELETIAPKALEARIRKYLEGCMK